MVAIILLVILNFDLSDRDRDQVREFSTAGSNPIHELRTGSSIVREESRRRGAEEDKSRNEMYIDPVTGMIKSRNYPALMEKAGTIVFDLRNSNDPVAMLANLVAKFEECTELENEFLWGTILTRLSEHESGQSALDFLSYFRSSLQGSMSFKMIGNGLNAYEELIRRIADKQRESPTPMAELIRKMGDEMIAEDFAPIFLSESGLWHHPVLDFLDNQVATAAQELQRKTLERLVPGKFTNQKAFSMLMSPDCIVYDDKEVLQKVISRSWFFDNAEAILNQLERAPPSPNREHALGRVVSLLAEVDKEKANEWLGLINDGVLRDDLRRKYFQ